MNTTNHTPYTLASMAECMNPDAPDSPGALFLLGVQDDVNETWADGMSGDEPSDTAHEIADMAVYNEEASGTYNKWRTFVDLGAWQEDPSELGYDASDMSKAADVCLYIIAERLVMALWDEHEAERDAVILDLRIAQMEAEDAEQDDDEDETEG